MSIPFSLSPLSIVIATPHERYKHIVESLAQQLPETRIFYLRSPEELSHVRLSEINPEYVFFPHWSWRIPESIYGNYSCVIFHMTDLPYGRGGSPLQNLIVRGHKSTQVSALKCIAELDAGRRSRLAGIVAGNEQVLITAAVAEDVPEELIATVFHVKQGEVTNG